MSKIEEILNRDINSIKDLKDAIKQLQDSIAGADPETEEFKSTVEQLTAAQEQLASVTKKSASETLAAKDSIVGMEKEYRSLYNTYKMLSEEQRNSGMGKQMAQDLSVLSDKLNETKKGVGNFKDNIGRYAESVTSVFQKMGISVGGLAGPLKVATTGMKGFNAVVKANPIGAILTLIMGLVAIFHKLREAVAQNEEKQQKLNELMAAFQPIIDGVKNGLDALANVFLKIVEWAGKAATAVRRFFAKDKEAFDEEQKVYKELAKTQNELTKKKREYQTLNAKEKSEVERLREEASATSDREEKQRLLTEAKEKQAEIDARNIEIAQQELAVLQQQAELTANDAEMNDKLAAALAKVSEAEATAAANARMFNRQMGSGSGGSGGGGGKSKWQQEAEDIQKAQEELEDYYRTEREKEERSYQEKLALFKKHHKDTTLLEKKHNEEIARIDKEEREKWYEQELDAFKQNVALRKRLRELELQSANPEVRPVMEKTFARQDLDYLKKQVEQIKPLSDKLRINPDDENIKTDLQKLVDKTNETLGTDIQFPPELSEKGIKNFQRQLDYLVKIYDAEFTQKVSDAFEQQVLNAFNEENKDFYDWLHSTSAAKEVDADIETEILTERQKKWHNIYLQRRKEAKDYVDYLRLVALTELEIDEEIWRVEEDLSSGEATKWNMAQYETKALDTRREYLQQLLTMDDEYNALTAERRLEVENELYEILSEQLEKRIALYEREKEFQLRMWDDIAGGIEAVAGQVSTVIEAYSSMYESMIDLKLKKGQIDEKEAAKEKKRTMELQKVLLAATIFQIAGQTATGIMGIWSAYAKELGVNAETALAAGPAAAAVNAALDAKSLVSAIINTTAMVGTAGANIAAASMGTIAKFNQFEANEGSSGSVGAVAPVASIDSTAYTFTRQLQTSEEEEMLNRPVYVTVTDIEDGLNKSRVRIAETSF